MTYFEGLMSSINALGMWLWTEATVQQLLIIGFILCGTVCLCDRAKRGYVRVIRPGIIQALSKSLIGSKILRKLDADI